MPTICGPESGQALTRKQVNAATFWSNVAVGHANECWEWKGPRNRNRYGVISIYKYRSGPVTAHRVAYAIAHGRLPAGKCVMHRCDNPPCVNPAHLTLGSHLDNMRDAMRKGRKAKEGKEFCKYGHHKGRKRDCRECKRIRSDREHERHVADSREQYEQYVATYVIPFAPSTLSEVIDITDTRRAHIFARVFGLYGFTAETAAAIGDDMGITRERVRQLRNDVMLRFGITHDVIRKAPAGVAFRLSAKQQAA